VHCTSLFMTFWVGETSVKGMGRLSMGYGKRMGPWTTFHGGRPCLGVIVVPWWSLTETPHPAQRYYQSDFVRKLTHLLPIKQCMFMIICLSSLTNSRSAISHASAISQLTIGLQSLLLQCLVFGRRILDNLLAQGK
jgi:hypothetical protein